MNCQVITKRRLTFTLLVFVIFPFAGSAQNAIFSSNGDYGFIGTMFGDSKSYLTDSLDREQLRVQYRMWNKVSALPEPVISDWYLLLGRNSSCFVNKYRFEVDSLLQCSPVRYSEMGRRYMKGDPFFFYVRYYREYSSDLLEVTGRIGADNFIYSDKIQAIQWVFLSNKKSICGHICKLAKGEFRGRTYFAYYTEEIPVSGGPWKTFGLPGLILSLEDYSGQYYYEAVSITPAVGTIRRTQYPYIRVSRKEYQKMMRLLQNNYVLSINNHLGGSNAFKVEQQTGMTLNVPVFEYLEMD